MRAQTLVKACEISAKWETHTQNFSNYVNIIGTAMMVSSTVQKRSWSDVPWACIISNC